MNCYRFNSEAQFLDLAEEEGLVAEDGSPILSSHEHALDILGVIYEGGTYDPETGEVITPPTALPGWHVNTLGLAPEAWDPHLIIVNSASRIFFGGPTQAPDTATLEDML